MQVSLPFYVSWTIATVLEVWACILVWRSGVFRRAPFFANYLILIAVREVAWWIVVHGWGYRSRTAFSFYWITQAIVLVARALVLAELCQSVLRGYRGIWALAWRLLVFLAVALVACAAWVALGHTDWFPKFIVTSERGLELAVVGTLLVLLAIAGYYEIEVGSLEKMIALGLGLYSAMQVFNNSATVERLLEYFPWWSWTRTISFQVAMVIWILAIRRPVPATPPQTVLLPQEVYDELSPRVNSRLRALNQNLLEMTKAMTQVTLFAVLAAGLLFFLILALRGRGHEHRLPAEKVNLSLEEMIPRHCCHFAQIRQALSQADERYVRQRGSPQVLRRLRAERRDVVSRFLEGLRDDFVRLDRLGRTVAALSPQVSRAQESERLWQGMRFRVLYRMAWLRLQAGSVSVPQLARLADLVGGLAAQIETAMAALDEASSPRRQAGLIA